MGFDMYTYVDHAIIRNRSPVFSVYGKTPRIFAKEMFFPELG